jgi:glycosyltransferase involved in cell wall biosynthesis
MRIALVHSFYRSDSPSGENAVVLSQAARLEKMGHVVRVFGANSDDLNFIDKAKLPWNVAFFRGKSLESEIATFGADLIHIHNLFPNIGFSWMTKLNIPVIATFHNFRPFCANGLLSRDSSACTDCLDLGSSRSLLHGCYKNSRIKTLPLTVATRQSGSHNPLLKIASKIIVLSEHSAHIYGGQIVNPERIRVLPNFSERLAPARDLVSRDYWLFVGRLSSEKGIEELLKAWPAGKTLLVYGSGELENYLKELYKTNLHIKFMGYLDQRSKADVFNGCKALVFPSTCFETSPLVMSEAFSIGRPIIAYSKNIVGMHIEKFGGGVTFSEFEGIPDAIRSLQSDEQGHSEKASWNYETFYSPEIWSRKLTAYYLEALKEF